MKYLKLFENHTAYETYINGSDVALPNVSLCVQENEVHYNPIVNETRLIAYYDIQDISNPTTICTNYGNSMVSMEIDDTQIDNVSTTYQFDSVGEHVIKYEFSDPTKIGSDSPLFMNVTALKRVEIPDSFTAITNNAFNSCSGLTSVVIGDGVTSIGNHGFYNCSGLTNVTIGSSVTSIGASVFVYCNSLTSVTIPNSVTSIGEQAFGYCHNLSSVTIPNNVVSIEGSAFYYCPNLTSVTISGGTIGGGAFSYCSGLTSVNLGSGVTSIGNGAFGACTNLTSVTVEATTPPTLGSTSFDNTNNCPIYVPAASVDAYKAASGWSTYASRIQAIPTP